MAVAGAILLAALAGYQLLTAGALRYYFEKSALGVVTTLVLLAPIPILRATEDYNPLRQRLLAGLIASLALVGLGSISADARISPLKSWAAFALAEYSQTRIDHAQSLLDLAEARAHGPGTEILVSGDLGLKPTLANDWYQTLTRHRTQAAAIFDFRLVPRDESERESLAEEVQRILQQPDIKVMITDPDVALLLRQSHGCERIRLVSPEGDGMLGESGTYGHLC